MNHTYYFIIAFFVPLLTFAQNGSQSNNEPIKDPSYRVIITLKDSQSGKEIESDINIKYYQYVDQFTLSKNNKKKNISILKNDYIFTTSDGKSNSLYYQEEFHPRSVVSDDLYTLNIKKKIHSFPFQLTVTEKGGDNTTPIPNAVVEIEDKSYRTDPDGILEIPNLPTNKLISFKINHKFYEPIYQSYYSTSNEAYNKVIPLTKKVFNKTIKLVNINNNSSPISGAIISFPEIEILEGRTTIDTTSSNGIATFANLPLGYHKVSIQPVTGYNKPSDEYFVKISPDAEESILKLTSIPIIIPPSIVISGTVTDVKNHPIIKPTQVVIKTDKGIVLSTLETKRGDFKDTILVGDFNGSCAFQVEVIHDDFQKKEMNMVISHCEYNSNIKSLPPIEMTQIYDYYTIALDKKLLGFKSPSVIFTRSTNKNNEEEIGEIIGSPSQKEGITTLKIRGPLNFQNIVIKYQDEEGELKTSTIHLLLIQKKKDHIEKHLWNIKRKRAKNKPLRQK